MYDQPSSHATNKGLMELAGSWYEGCVVEYEIWPSDSVHEGSKFPVLELYQCHSINVVYPKY
ncbi:hypothetical protein SCLCIDRAFT_1207944 [Scleroderma citrinum Foug A]|uniref:Uncharacterized protein n=1 Tax=Scleroderma citrinum Foug A TaxID=1036808 RepID=A0A0C3ENS1_9AGAM|nr:hypothetical protein SCLCIDRAFT_1207944 [Scleroderma citrinum Foug A]